MKLSNERKSEDFIFSVDISEEEEQYLQEAGLKMIKKDKKALINYAINKLLENYVEILVAKDEKSDSIQE